MNKTKFFLSLLIIVAIAGGTYYFLYGTKEELASEKAEKLGIQGLSTEGEVIFVGPKDILIRTAKTDRTEAGNALLQYDRKVSFVSRVGFTEGGKTEVINATTTLARISVGDRLGISGFEIKEGDELVLKATKVEVINR